ncbi:MAG: hypothetical protein QG670_376 [Thermoproteota archaeon]|nr:hypothetical protein [Thermoproteota archaeon]
MSPMLISHLTLIAREKLIFQFFFYQSERKLVGKESINFKFRKSMRLGQGFSDHKTHDENY